jgi:hypothetical protein
VVPFKQPEFYLGGEDCLEELSCKTTTNKLQYLYKDTYKYKYTLPIVETQFSLDETEPPKDKKLIVYHATNVDYYQAHLYPFKIGEEGKTTETALGIWGMNPQSEYFDYLREIYP